MTMFNPNDKPNRFNFNGIIKLNKEVFDAGESVECSVSFNATNDFNIVWLELYLAGYYRILEKDFLRRERMSNKKVFFLLKHTAHGSPDSLPMLLDPYYKCDVNFKLPLDIPPTLEFNFGKLKYFVYAYARRRNQPDAMFKCKFRVTNTTLLTRALRSSQIHQGQWNKGEILCLFDDTSTTASASTDHKGYLQGEFIDIYLIMNNRTDNIVDVFNLVYTLVRIVSIRKDPLKKISNKDNDKTFPDVINSVTHGNSFTCRDNVRIDLNGRLRVPEHCLSSCKTDYVDISYQLKVEFDIKRTWKRWCERSMTIRVPITICGKESIFDLDSDEYPFLHLAMPPEATSPQMEDQQIVDPSIDEPTAGPSRPHRMEIEDPGEIVPMEDSDED